MSNIVPFNNTPAVTIPASARIATFSDGLYSVVQVTPLSANGPVVETVLFRGAGLFTSSTFASAATVRIEGGAQFRVLYSVGTDAVIIERLVVQGAPTALDATGALTAAAMLGRIVTSTTAAAVTGTLPTGTVLDAANTFAVNDSIDWDVINTGGANAFTVAAATGHTIVGSATVAASSSGAFRTRKTAANTFVTYRLG